MFEYILNTNNHIIIDGELIIKNSDVLSAIHFSNQALKSLDEETRKFDINIFEALGMRNLSGLVGEYFAKSVQRHSCENLTSNLHQDGYPDLLLVNNVERKKYYSSLFKEVNGRKYPISKEAFSPFKYGGIEVKATCGSTPSAAITSKPLIGEQRISLVNQFDWKAHHRETNNLLAILWDFLNDVPTIVACFFSNDLSTCDWGKIVQPKDGGGRTTSVSIMASTGIKKMCSGWIAVIDIDEYIQKLSNRKWIGYSVK